MMLSFYRYNRFLTNLVYKSTSFNSLLQPIVITIRSLHHIRNVGVIAHIDAGKTTTTEQMLFLCGETKHVGRVDNGNTVMDFLPEERERGITISAAAISFDWKKHLINLIDTPGHVDFTIEVERSARVLDGSIIIIDAVSGVQAQTLTVWKQTRKQNIPAIAFVNKMDRFGADFVRTVQSIKTKLMANVVPIQIPFGQEEHFKGVIDLISMKSIVWEDNISRTPSVPVVTSLSESDDLFEEAMLHRKTMIETLAELDDPLMEKYLSDESIDTNTLLPVLRRLCCDGSVLPVLCGASLRGKGVEPLLDSLVAFLPSPADRPAVTAVRRESMETKTLKPSESSADPLCAIAFKVVYDSMRGPLVYIRIYSGVLNSKQSLYNSSRKSKERINQILRVSADDYESVSEVGPGSVCCLVGMKTTRTGDTLVSENLSGFVLEGLTVPKPVFSLAIEPEKSSQQDELEKALEILCIEDPSLQVELNIESGQTIIKGIGELHLEIVCNKLKRVYNLEVTQSNSYVAYRESIINDVEVFTEWFSYDRTVYNKRMFASLQFEVTATGSNDEPIIVISDSIKNKLNGDEYNSLSDGLISSLSRGPKGYPIIGINIKVIDINKDSDTTPGSMRACVSMFVDSVMKSDKHILLEPIMSIEIELPTSYMGSVLSDLTSTRRAVVKEVVPIGTRSCIKAVVPLSSVLGYASSLRSMTQGEGFFSLEYDTHEVLYSS